MGKRRNPTAAELEILAILWQKEPLTVKEIHEKLLRSRNIGYTTALKLMQNMTKKGLLRREPKGKSHLYYSCYSEDVTQQNLLSKLVDSAFGGSASKLVMQLLGNNKTSQQEIEEIKAIINKMDNNE